MLEYNYEKSRSELAKYRLDRAEEEYRVAMKIMDSGYYKAANNRAYYSIFHSMRAALALEGIDFKKHSGVIAYFRQNYIKSGLIETKFSDIIGNASDIRTASDYDDFYIATKEEAQELIGNAIEFYHAVEVYVSKHLQATDA